MSGTTYTMFSSQGIHKSWMAWTSWVGPYSTKTLTEMLIRSRQAQGKAPVFARQSPQLMSQFSVTPEDVFSLPQHQRCVISCLSIHLWKSTSSSASRISMLINNSCVSSVGFKFLFHSRNLYNLLMILKNHSAFPPKATLENQPQAVPRKKYRKGKGFSDVCWRTLICTIIHLTSLIVPASLFILYQRWNKLLKSCRNYSKARHAFSLVWIGFQELWGVMQTPVLLVHTWLNSWKSWQKNWKGNTFSPVQSSPKA